MDARGKKKTSRGPSSSKSTPITRRHLQSLEDDPSDVRDLRMHSVIIERPVSIEHTAPFGILPLLRAVGWDNILHWGGPAYQSIT